MADRAIWLRREGIPPDAYFVVLIEVENEWIELIREYYDGPASHIIEPLGIQSRIDTAHGIEQGVKE